MHPDAFYTDTGYVSQDDRVIYFDMDGTIADLYGVRGWLAALESENPAPYRDAQLMVSLSDFIDFAENARTTGWKLGIISWLSKGSTLAYDEDVTYAKLEWIEDNLPEMDQVIIAPYGVPKSTLTDVEEAVLIDDEEANRLEWDASGPLRTAYHPNEMPTLMALMQSSSDAFTSAVDETYHPLEYIHNAMDLMDALEDRLGILDDYGLTPPEVLLDSEDGYPYIALGEWAYGENFDSIVFVADPDRVSDDECRQAFTMADDIIRSVTGGALSYRTTF